MDDECVTCQVSLQLNETSDADEDNDNDASSDPNDKMSSSEDEDTETNNKLQTDQLSESPSSNGLTVTPIKIKCHPKRVRTMDRILHLQHVRRRGRPPLTPNVSFRRNSFESLARTLSPVASSTVAKIRRMRGRPKGSKNKVKKCPLLGNKQSDKNKQNTCPRITDALETAQWPPTAVEDSVGSECLEEADSNKKSSKQTFWRPPTDADSRRVLDQISITDITANALTVTVRESATQDGFFRS